MNKLFTKIAGVTLGFAMAIGVGVAVAGKQDVKVARAAGDETVDFTAQGYTNQQAVPTYNGANFSVSWDKGTNSNAPKYFTSGTAVRVYGGGKMTVSSTTKTISKIEITGYSGNTFTTSPATFDTSKATWTGSASSVVFTSSGTTGNTRVQKLDVYFETSDVAVTITGSTTVNEGTPVTYSCDSGVTATWTLEDVSPAGCATISGSTVTAHQTGTATLVCTPSTAGYKKNSVNLTLKASIKHNSIAAGNYFIVAAADVASVEYGSLLKPEETAKNPVGITPDYSDATLAWAIEENPTADNAYNIKKGDLYLVASDAAQGITITKTAPDADKYWTITTNGVDSYGNTQYWLQYIDGGTRYLSLYADNHDFRNYSYNASYKNNDMNLIPVERELTALTVGGTLTKSSYDQNDDFDPTGATVKGTFTNGYGDAANAYIDVTEDVTWTPSKLTTEGSVNVYAKINDVQSSNSFEVTVTAVAVPVTGVSVSPTTKIFQYSEINTTQQLTATVEPDNASNKAVTWESNNTAVATVSTTGLVTAKGVGSATITATTVNGGFTATCEITVNDFVGDYNKLSNSVGIHDGMVITLGNATKQAVATGFGTFITAAQNSATIVGSGLCADTVLEFTLGGKVGAWTLQDADGNYLSQTAAAKNTLALDKTGENKYWNIEIEDGQATIENIAGNDFGALYFNSSSPRISNYQSQGSMALPEVYAKDSSDNILTFIKNNMRMGDVVLNTDEDTGACKQSGNSYYLTAKAALSALTQGERDDFENNEGEKYTEALKRYKAWAVANNDAEPFDGEATVVTTLKASGTFGTAESNEVATIVVIIAIASISAFGCLLILKKRKHQ